MFFCVVATWRRTAVCALSTLTFDRIWVGSGSMNLRDITPTSAQALAHTSAVQTPPTARYGAGLMPRGALGPSRLGHFIKKDAGRTACWMSIWWSGVSKIPLVKVLILAPRANSTWSHSAFCNLCQFEADFWFALSKAFVQILKLISYRMPPYMSELCAQSWQGMLGQDDFCHQFKNSDNSSLSTVEKLFLKTM